MGYIIQEYEKDPKKIAENWELAIGLQKVDNLVPSDYLISVAKLNIEGEITYETVHALLYEHYEKEINVELHRQKECDMVSARIVDYLGDHSFSLSPVTLTDIHQYLFQDIYDFAGQMRQYNITKKESILGGKSVTYTDYKSIAGTLTHDIREEKEFSYAKCDKKETIKHLSNFTSNIWQVHPFMEGNTRTTALFMQCYLNSMGFKVDNKMFANHAKYFRNALVRANYAEVSNGIFPDNVYLQVFYENLIFGGTHKLQNRNLIINHLVEESLP